MPSTTKSSEPVGASPSLGVAAALSSAQALTGKPDERARMTLWIVRRENIAAPFGKIGLMLKNVACPQITQIYADQTIGRHGEPNDLLGEMALAGKRLKICVNLRNLRIDPRLPG